MSNMKWVFATCQVEGIHYWPDAPAEVGFLKYPHRHMFHVKLSISVDGDNRELEFIKVKRWLTSTCIGIIGESVDKPVTKSCEMFAKEIIDEADVEFMSRKFICEVSEDGENGAVISND